MTTIPKIIDYKSINQLLLNDIYNLFDAFQMEYKELHDRFELKCPVHHGNKKNSCTIYKDSGLWYCWTHSCHEKYQRNLFALFKTIMNYSTGQMVEWCYNRFDNKITTVAVNTSQNKFINIMSILDKKLENSGIFPNEIKDAIKIPSEYFLRRGFSSDILTKYDVGDSIDNNLMYNRAIVPVYNYDHTLITGYIGRRISDNENYAKWINSKFFHKNDTLYNIWFAQHKIPDTHTLILVEGQGDVWRLEESGIYNSVGIFGATLSDNQMFLIEQLPIHNLIVLTDNDIAGIEAKHKIIDKCRRLYNIHSIDIPKKDIGEMSVNEIQDIILPVMEKL